MGALWRRLWALVRRKDLRLTVVKVPGHAMEKPEVLVAALAMGLPAAALRGNAVTDVLAGVGAGLGALPQAVGPTTARAEVPTFLALAPGIRQGAGARVEREADAAPVSKNRRERAELLGHKVWRPVLPALAPATRQHFNRISRIP